MESKIHYYSTFGNQQLMSCQIFDDNWFDLLVKAEKNIGSKHKNT